MDGKVFSKKEALSHGIAMTKKYFGIIFVVIVIVLLFDAFQGGIRAQAGSSRITKEDVRGLYPKPAQTVRFYGYLQSSGYINDHGWVTQKLQKLADPSQLYLPPDLEPDRGPIFRFLQFYRYRLPFPKAVYYLLALGLWIVGIIIQIGILKISLMLARDQKPDVAELVTNGRFLIPYLLATIGYGLAVIGGAILLIVPGIILGVMLGMYPYLILDGDLGPLEALKASRALTKGVRGQLFIFGVVLALINVLGALCLVVGLVFTIPATSVAWASVYDRLHARAGEENEGTAEIVPA